MKYLGVVVAAALAAVGCGDQQHATGDASVDDARPEEVDAAPTVLEFNAQTVTFDPTMVDTQSGPDKVITLKNLGTETVSVTVALEGAGANDFTLPAAACTTLPSREVCTVTVRFAPHAVGNRTATLVARAADGSASVALEGISIPVPGLSVAQTLGYAIGDQRVGTTSAVGELLVRNDGTIASAPVTVSIVGPDASRFALVTNGCAGPIAAFTSCTVGVQFSPTTTGVVVAKLRVDSPNFGRVEYGLYGNGTTPPFLSVSIPSAMFGTVARNSTSLVQTVTIQNSGTDTALDVSVGITGDAAQFVFDTPCNGSLVGNSSCTFSLVYRPTVVGTHTATLTVSSTGLPTLAIPLSGTANATAELRMTPVTHDFGMIDVGQTSAVSVFTVENLGAPPSGSLAVTLTQFSTAFTIASDTCSGASLAQHQTCAIGVTASSATNSEFYGSLQVTGLPGGTVGSSLHARVVGPAHLVTAPGAWAAGDVQLTDVVTQTFAVKNTGDFETGTMAVSLAGADAADFSIVSDTCTGRSIGAQVCSVSVDFTPSHLGAESATLSVTSPATSSAALLTAIGVPAPTLTLSPTSHDFGTRAFGEASPAAVFTLTNEALTVSGMLSVTFTGELATEVALVNDTCSGVALAANASCSFAVVTTPATAGHRAGTVDVSGLPGGHARAQLAVTGALPAAIFVTPTPATFDATVVGSMTSAKRFVATNTGGAGTGPLTVAVTGAAPSQFTVEETTCTGISLAPGMSCTVDVVFAPSTVGMVTAELRVTGTSGASTPAVVQGLSVAPPALVFTPATYDFGDADAHRSDFSGGFVVRNAGGVTAGPITVTNTSMQATQFAVVDQCSGAYLLPGGTCAISINFRPTASGLAQGTITVQAPATTATATYRGNALPQEYLVLAPSPFDFGTVTVGQTSITRVFTATNAGELTATAVSVGLTGDQPTQFRVASTTCGSTLAPAQTCEVRAEYKPTTAGPATAFLYVLSPVGSGRTVTVTGTGVP